jgi:hypothetical protein
MMSSRLVFVEKSSHADMNVQPIENHYPIPTKRNPGSSDYFFPIGYSIFLHDWQTGVPTTEYVKNYNNAQHMEEDWVDGVLSVLKDSNTPWNVVYGVPRPTILDTSAKTVDESDFVDLLDMAESTEGGLKTLKVWPGLLYRRHRYNRNYDTWSLVAGINTGWTNSYEWYKDQYLRESDSDLEDAINAIKNKSSLAGWMLADEPYAGDVARVTTELTYENSKNTDVWVWIDSQQTSHNLWEDSSINPFTITTPDNNWLRDDIYFRLAYYLLELQNNLDTGAMGENHPIHCVIRADGNYLDPDTQPELNKSARVMNVLHDDIYLGNGDPHIGWRSHTYLAIENIISPEDHTSQHGFVMWLDGMSYKVQNPTPDVYKHTVADEDLRYTAYSSLVHGARGIMFWFMSKSEDDAYDQARKIGKEVETMSPYLLADHPAALDGVYLDSNIDNTEAEKPQEQQGQNFIVRINPNNSNQALVVIANDSSQDGSVWIQFPGNWQISSVQSIDPSYGWSYTLNNNRLGVGVADWYARAFIVTKQ